MRLYCLYCGKSVSTELPDSMAIRAPIKCFECIEKALTDVLSAWSKTTLEPTHQSIEKALVPVDELKNIIQELFERREYHACWFASGDCAPWKACKDEFPTCPLVKLAKLAGYEMTEKVKVTE